MSIVGKPLPPAFFSNRTTEVSENLIGKYLVRIKGKTAISAMITETEAYDGFKDKGSHAHRGRTKRNAPMFGPAGHWYVYIIYGMYWMMNIVTREQEYPAAVLIRGGRTESGLELNGPGKLSRFLQLDKNFVTRINGRLAAPQAKLWIEDRNIKIPRTKVEKAPRIGIPYAEDWQHKKWRFVLKTRPK